MTADISKRSVCVFCGSSTGAKPHYMALATATGEALAAHSLRLVYGGGGTGLMGATARAVHQNGGDVLGIIPEFLMSAERAFTDVETRIVPDMHTRKMQMFEESNAFIILPGGIGTLEEVMEVMSWQRLQLHQKPIIFLSDTGYWDGALKLLEHTVSEKFSPEWMMDDISAATSAEEAVAIILREWDGPEKTLKPVAPIEGI